MEKQKQILSAKKPLDIGDPAQMSEPSLPVIAVVVLLFVLLARYRNRLFISFRK